MFLLLLLKEGEEVKGITIEEKAGYISRMFRKWKQKYY